MNSLPKISVVIPFFNRAIYAREVIDSVINQNYKNYEIITVDDGSTDEVPSILESYRNQIKVIYQGKKGPVAARNRGMEEADGDYIAYLDSDDVMLPWALETYASVINKLNRPPLIVARVHFFRSSIDIEHLKTDRIRYVLLDNYLKKDRQIFTTFSMMVIRKDILKRIGGSRVISSKTFLGDDFDILIRLSEFGPAVLIREPRTILYRVHNKNESIFNIDKMSIGILALLKKEREKDYPGNRKQRLLRYAYLGGPVSDWGRRAVKAGYYKIGFALLIKGSPMILAKIYQKFFTSLKGKKESKTL